MELAEEFMGLFSGLERAYGTFEARDSRERDGKKTGRVNNVRSKVTRDIWLAHLNGKQAIGIIPIRDDNTCVFGAIDIDVYDIDPVKMVKEIDRYKMPLVATSTKSGGFHLWLFIKEPIAASFVQRKLREMSSTLGYGRAEIFPKQTEVIAERGDIGNWINMPYFNGIEGKRYGIHLDGTPMPPLEFIELCKTKIITPQALENFGVISGSKNLADGPPCLQHLSTQGFPQGTRNSGLYNLGVYTKKAFPDSWEKVVEQYNLKYMQPPLDSGEVKEIVKSLKKKEYQYTCTQIPIVNHCNSAVCRGRKFGVGDHSGMPVVTGLTKYDSSPPIWFADIEGGGRLELSTEDLQSQLRFQKRCMEILNSMPTPMNQKAWQAMIQGLLDSVTIIDAPKDATAKGQLNEMVEKFCTQRAQALSKDEVRLGKPFTESNKHYFTINGLMAFLERHKYRDVKLHELSSYLKNEMQANHHFFNFKGKGVNCWSIEAFSDEPKLDVPKGLSDGSPF